MRFGRQLLCSTSIISALIFVAQGAGATLLVGDLDGDGIVGGIDFGIFRDAFGTSSGSPAFNPVADFDGDGTVGGDDFATFSENLGAMGGATDVEPPGVTPSLNDIPDDMNDLLVVPPESFWITLSFDASGGSLMDVSSLSITSSQAIGAIPAGAELTPQMAVTPTGARWEIPAGSALALTSHFLTVSVKDMAGNEASEEYGFAVRDFGIFGPPLGNPQTVFLDFTQDRSLGPEVDFLEDLREFGLSSPLAPAIETQARDLIVAEIVNRVNAYYGSTGSDPVNITFTDALPSGTHARMCVGGESVLGAPFLGAAPLDLDNAQENEDNCAGPVADKGVFPQAIDDLWGSNAEYHASFDALKPSEGGIPNGEHPDDARIWDPLFDPATATLSELNRLIAIVNAADAFAWVVATAIAHESGHLLGLTAPGAAPGGLYGGSTGSAQDHNEMVGGGTPGPNFLMNEGASFTFEEMTGRGGTPLATFRPLNWAYLHNRIVRNDQVTNLDPPPQIASVTPNTVDLPPDAFITISGDDFVATPDVHLIIEGDPTPNLLSNITWIDPQTLSARVKTSTNPPGLYDVRVTNPDGQSATLVDGLLVQ